MTMKLRRILLDGLLASVILFGLVLTACPQIQAETPTQPIDHSQLAWPGKTGPTNNGQAAPQQCVGLPQQWDESAGEENIAWKVKLTRSGHSTPVVGHGKIWLTEASEDGRQQFLVALDPVSGETVHDVLLFENADPEPLGNPVNSYASPTCVLTPDAVYVHFGTYGTARLDPRDASVVWQRRDINCRHFRGPGSSPIVWNDLIVLTFDGIDKQFVTALWQADGKTAWLTPRTTDYGDLDADGKPRLDGDLRKACGTPTIAHADGQAQVISVGSRAAFGYDAATGREVWTIRHDDYNAAAQPLAFRDTAIINTGSRGANLLAVRLNASTQGDVSDSHVVWDRQKRNSRLAFPALVDGRVYSVTENGVVVCVSAESGKELWTGRVGGNFIASPVAANGLLYLLDQRGKGTVIRQGDKFEVVATNQLDEGCTASPSIAGGALYVRTKHYLYKIAK